MMQVSAATPYRHVVPRRRDEPSRPVSKFIAEAQGTWFKDCARKVFTQVAEGDRKLSPLPVDRAVGHDRHSADSTVLSTLARTLIETRGQATERDIADFEAAGFRREQALEVLAVIAASTITNYAGSLAAPPLEDVLEEHRWAS